MNATTRTSRLIKGDTLNIYCDTNNSVEVFTYISGQISFLNVSYIQKNNDFKMAVIPVSSDGYYFVKSGKNVQSLKKGNVPYKLFMFDALNRTDLTLNPESYDEDGTKIGDNIYEHIGFGIYAITPLVLTPSIVRIMGKIFHSFPNSSNIDCEDINRASSTVSIGTSEETMMISIGETSTDLSVEDTSVGINVGQTIFKV